ncbi:hypothetical protein, partial [Escherichia coli]|uniref:hypothetical protein n=1 Tax=Escherichia coli TaxID=562 RepID=UPI0021C6F4F5
SKRSQNQSHIAPDFPSFPSQLSFFFFTYTRNRFLPPSPLPPARPAARGKEKNTNNKTTGAEKKGEQPQNCAVREKKQGA